VFDTLCKLHLERINDTLLGNCREMSDRIATGMLPHILQRRKGLVLRAIIFVVPLTTGTAIGRFLSSPVLAVEVLAAATVGKVIAFFHQLGLVASVTSHGSLQVFALVATALGQHVEGLVVIEHDSEVGVFVRSDAREMALVVTSRALAIRNVGLRSVNVNHCFVVVAASAAILSGMVVPLGAA